MTAKHSAAPVPRRRGGLTQIVLVLVAGCALLYLLLLVLAPWNFYLGGHFHVVPGWTGQGWLRSDAAGGTYHLWLSFTPTTPRYRRSPLKGVAYLCSPRGELFRLRFGGDMPRNHGTDLRGLPIHLYMTNWSAAAQFAGDRRPALDLYGTFGDSTLILQDKGSLARAFRSDGTLSAVGDQHSWQQPSTAVTLQESGWTWRPACKAAR